ncbi:MAG: ribonuclease PH [Alphaproteobacteria bacterium TMED194]|nr:MAG: ribonuclease PH [Alphaproteobacteria bacterium TMED194]|tara:strand:- start:2097 stop:2801 length:705 start_codon:yes stop_codon:yes gene_type:complete
MRSNRKFNELRKIKVEINFMKNAFSSCLIEFGLTKVICSVTVEEKIPRWLKGTNQGWLTAEYSMLPTSTNTRNDRESIRGKLSGRTQEIQRLIGRSLRNCLNLSLLSEKLIKIDCDVLSADGGTRTTSINGSWIALNLAIKKLLQNKVLKNNPIKYGVSAISCGIISGNPFIDLNYIEDSSAEADANFVFDSHGNIIEIQCTGEKTVISERNFTSMYNLAKKSISQIYQIQSNI